MTQRFVGGVCALIVGAVCGILAVLIRPQSLGFLAYVQSGDIWIKDLPDGESVRLTDDSLSSSPRISPSGRWLAFRKGDGHVWIVKTDGQSANLVYPEKVTHYKWAPGSDRLAFIANGELRILTAGQNGSRLLVPCPREKDSGVNFEFLWSPDGKWITYEYTERRDVAEGEWPGKDSIRKVNMETGDSEEIIAYPPPDDQGFPGNTALAAWVGTRIYLWQCEIMSASIMADGCPLFFFDPEGKQKEVGVTSLLYPDFLTFAPDTGTLAIAEGPDRFTWTNKRIVQVDPNRGEKKTLTEPDVAASCPVWSPDGASLAYVAGPDIGPDFISEDYVLAGMTKRRIWIMKAEGSEKRRLTNDESFGEDHPLWLPDGRHILFARIVAQGRASVWLARKDGKTPDKVADLVSVESSGDGIRGYYGHVGWSEVFDYSGAGR
jgi:Tol biopolymer transport system component